ncbi:MAG: nuclear transport factor 2 family protein [Thermoanaerobaculia bacterium]
MDTKQVGKKLVDLCKAGQFVEAINTLYSPDIISVEARGDEKTPAQTRGIDAIRKKNQWWTDNHEVHPAEVSGPYPNEDRFATRFRFDVTPKAGPMQGKRMMMDEVALYTVKNGKIVREEFFYDMG